ncbi:MAG: VCBS repeat-containing protein [Planctomycetes bacterium]|nr:VCBS repeat-containing protein [Planctomycetota bacterium]
MIANLCSLLILSCFQQFTNVGGVQVPNLGKATEAAKFGDFDLDGDLDLVYANGGDSGNQQSHLLINNGLAQAGVLGFYSNATATNLLPNLAMSSRDVQAFDIDNDGDLDLMFSNHSQNVSQSNAFFINQGLAQGGAAGMFMMDLSRYTGLGIHGSSIPAGQLITTGAFAGGFQDWSGQCDFADVDFDGDLDLYQASVGSSLSGSVMSRMFLNGQGSQAKGYFAEYNPSAAVSGNPNLPNLSPAGFLEGTHVNNTSDVTGANHDITNICHDLDFADLDGDFDLDIFALSEEMRSRFYMNRFYENGQSAGGEGAGTRLFRDITAQWGANVADPTLNYDAELADLDQDGAVDGYFVNFAGSTKDGWGLNNGTGVIGPLSTVPVSDNDDQEADMIDYDQDGDLDVYIAAFSGNDRFYKNQFLEKGSVNLIQVTPASGVGTSTLAADVGDMDNDGDFDIICAENFSSNEVLLKNNLNIPETNAPRVTNIKIDGSPVASSSPRRVLARAFDNAEFEYFRSATGTVEYTVNGLSHSAPARWSGGNVWRAEIPGYWFGNITYTMKVKDRAGNTGASAAQNLTIPAAGFANYGAATAACSGTPRLGVNSAPTIDNPDFTFLAANAPANTLGILAIGDAQGSGALLHNTNVALWVDLDNSVELFYSNLYVNSAGAAAAAFAIPNNSALVGKSYFAQGVFSEPACAPQLSATAGFMITILP